MKLVKMSLAAAVLLGGSAFAIDNVKVSGDAKVYYSTTDADWSNNDMFDKDASAADTALRLGVTGDLHKNISFGATAYAISTLGLENNLVSGTWTGAHGVTTGTGASFLNDGDALDVDGAQVDDQAWMGELWLAATMGKTTAKVGRMELDTPFAYSEKWSIVPNTFDAAVLLNQDIPDTTLVGAWVGKGNGVNAINANNWSVLNAIGGSVDAVVGADGKFGTFMDSGAYAAGIVNNSFKPLVAQAWYYNVSNVADAYWLQADINCQLVKGVTIGAQYGEMSPKGLLEGLDDSSAYAFKLGYEGIENLKVSAAYSKADDKELAVLAIANVATDNLWTAESKLYTETFWNRGWVGMPDAESWNAKISYDMKGIAKVCASYTNVEIDRWNEELDEVMVGVSRSFGPLDAKLAYINSDYNDAGVSEDADTINAYLTLNF